MEFSSFAQILKPIIAEGASMDVFAQTLFLNITKFPDEDNNVVADTPLATFKSYYSGRRGLSRFARKIMKNLEPERFVAFISGAGDAAQKEIFHELSPYCPEMTDWDVAESCAELFCGIIRDAAKKTPKKRKARTREIPGGAAGASGGGERSLQEMGQADLYLLAECALKCPVCGRKLVYEKKGIPFCRYRAVPIFPYGLENAERVPFEEKREAPERLDSAGNRIMLCCDCAEVYQRRTTPDEYLKMCMVKDGLRDAYHVQQAIDAKDIETEIEEVFRQKELEGTLRYKKVRNEVSDCFESLNRMDYSRSQIFSHMVQWLLEHTEGQKREACEAVISFFVQNCEVF